MNRFHLMAILIVFGCSESEEEPKKSESSLSFNYNGRAVKLSMTDPNDYPSVQGSYQFAVSPGDTYSSGITSLTFSNPNKLQDAPCFTLNMVDKNGSICGFIAAGSLTNLCGSSIIGSNSDECSFPGIFDPMSHDQKLIYSLFDVIFEINPFGCVTQSVWDPYAGKYFTVSTCNYSGTFSFNGVNLNRDTITVSDGKFTNINIHK